MGVQARAMVVLVSNEGVSYDVDSSPAVPCFCSSALVMLLKMVKCPRCL